MSVKLNLVICEDHPIYARGLKDFLINYFNVTGCFDTGRKAVDFLLNNVVDILLLDLNLLDINGLQVVKELNENEIKVKIVVISMYDDKLLIEKCKKYGVHAYCSKHIANSELLEIIDSLEFDQFIVDKGISKKLTINSAETPKESFEKKIRLTNREIELIPFFIEGLTSKEISKKLNVSLFTVNSHKKNIHKKLNISSTAELVKFYYENM
ncbi:MAG: response regulator transcription factor [Winogradskyella sp.]|nr:response regulator transcription factor [Winogradskyella sp.]